MREDAPRRSVASVAKRLLLLVVFAVLGGAILWLVSERNAKTFAVELRAGELVVLKGRELPTGFAPYSPVDKLLARAYAPIPLSGDSPGELLNAPYPDKDRLDQALFRTLRAWVEVRLDADDPERLAQALKYLRRAELLMGITADQRDELRALQGKVAYVEGRARLEEAEVALREATARLRLAAEVRGRYSREAGELFERVNPLSEQLSRTVRQTAPRETAAAQGADAGGPDAGAPDAEVPAEAPVPAAPDAGTDAPDAG